MNETKRTVLRVSEVSVRFGGLRALDRVSVDILAGESRAVIGPNGAGKTTLFNVIGGSIQPSSGHVDLEGRQITGLPPDRVRRLGISRAFQTPSVFPALSVRQNIWLGVLFADKLRWNPVTRAERRLTGSHGAEEIARSMGLQDLLDRAAGDLSHADQKLLDMAIALALDPKVVLLDEPTQGLSPDEVGRIAAVIKKVMQEQTVVMIEHNVATVLEIATRITVLDRGVVIAEGPPDSVVEDERVQSVYLGHESVEGH
jgi:branched-chain amino acid transport system ATP-binding protein